MFYPKHTMLKMSLQKDVRQFLAQVAAFWKDSSKVEEVHMTAEAIEGIHSICGPKRPLVEGAGSGFLQDPQSSLGVQLSKMLPYLTFTDVQTPMDPSSWPKSAPIIGPEDSQETLAFSDQVVLTLLVLQPGQKLPQTFEPEADMVVHVLESSPGAKIGQTDFFLEDAHQGDVSFFLHTMSKVFEPGTGPLVLLLARTGDLKSTFIFPDITAGDEYVDSLKVVSNPEAYYRNFAKNYEESVVGWGYSIPAETVRATLRSYRPKTSADILDLGCGDGLVGVELKKQGFFNIKGVDLSEEMLAKAATRGCYVTVQKVDLLKKLPFEDETFDCLISVGVTTYLNPSVIAEWLRVTKPGGLVSFSHKVNKVAPAWEPEQSKWEQSGSWMLLWSSEDRPYLPSLKSFTQEWIRIYVYKKREGVYSDN